MTSKRQRLKRRRAVAGLSRRRMLPRMSRRVPLPRPEIDPELTWLVVRTEPQRDERVVDELSRLGFAAWAPKMAEERLVRGRLATVETFPASGYAFTGTTFALQRVSEILAVSGAQTILGLPEAPVAISGAILQEFADRLTLTGTATPLTVGQRVEITEGIFAGRLAVVSQVSPRRARVALSGMGHGLGVVDIPAKHLRVT